MPGSPAKYRTRRSRPVEAMQVTDRNGAEVEAWCGGHSFDVAMAPGQTHHVKVTTPIGTVHARPRDYVVRNLQGTHDVLLKEVFEATYEAVNRDAR